MIHGQPNRGPAPFDDAFVGLPKCRAGHGLGQMPVRQHGGLMADGHVSTRPHLFAHPTPPDWTLGAPFSPGGS